MLTCCEAAKTYPAIYFDVEIYGDYIPVGTAAWRACMTDPAGRGIAHDEYREWVVNQPAAKFCPYCGTPTPKMKLKDPPPKGVMKCTDAGYYCDTCEERLRCCQCKPPEFNYEPEVEDVISNK
jgi:hypothetical protein